MLIEEEDKEKEEDPLPPKHETMIYLPDPIKDPNDEIPTERYTANNVISPKDTETSIQERQPRAKVIKNNKKYAPPLKKKET